MNYAILSRYSISGGNTEAMIYDADTGDACINTTGISLTTPGAFSPNGLWYANSVAVYLISDFSILYTLTSSGNTLNHSNVFSSNSRYFFYTKDANPATAYMVDTSTWTIVKTITITPRPLHPSTYYNNLSLSPDNRYLCFGHSQDVLVFDLLKNTPVSSFVNPFEDEEKGCEVSCFSPNGKYLALGCVSDNPNLKPLILLNTEDWSLVDFEDLNVNDFGFVNTLKFTPDSNYLVIGTYVYVSSVKSIAGYREIGLFVLDLQTFTYKKDIEIPEEIEMVVSIDFHPKENKMLIGKESENDSYVVYDLSTWQICQHSKRNLYSGDQVITGDNTLDGKQAIYSPLPILKKISGYVYDINKNPVQATVISINLTTLTSERIITSDADGFYQFTYLDSEKRLIHVINPNEVDNDMAFITRPV